jgi:Ca2+ transporting ATPase
VFHTFVVCQLFNEVNARKIHGEFNVLSGLFNNYLYLAIMAFQVR